MKDIIGIKTVTPTPSDFFGDAVAFSKARQASVPCHYGELTQHYPLVTTEKPQVDCRSVDAILHEKVSRSDTFDGEDAFFVADLGEVVRQYRQFRRLLPRIEPFFAMKCNPDPMVIKTLIDMGTGFDCASKGEIKTVLDMGVDPNDIIYANPCKQASHVRYAAENGVDMMTFDNMDELVKIHKMNPKAKMVLRILADDSRSLCKFGVKFGASLSQVPILLQGAKDLGVDVIGISFHVGSGCFDAAAFSDAVILARKAFDIGEELGFKFELLDVGGGFPGNGPAKITFEEIAAELGPTVDRLFPPHIRVIAEPGRYFVSSAYTLAVNVVARRVVQNEQEPSYMYYINDGMYGSFNCILFDHAEPVPRVLYHRGKYVHGHTNKEPLFNCSMWGPTCDSMDCITRKQLLPKLEVGDWLYFENMGAYTCAAASEFNGFKKSTILYTNTEEF